jgi:hypothetical protein
MSFASVGRVRCAVRCDNSITVNRRSDSESRFVHRLGHNAPLHDTDIQGIRGMSAFGASCPPSGAMAAIALSFLSMTHWVVVIWMLQQVTLN